MIALFGMDSEHHCSRRELTRRRPLDRREDLVDLSNRTVLIVGGTSGIGRELARRFAAAGSTVAVGGRSAEALSELATEGFGTFGVDVTDGASVRSVRDAVLARYPELDTVVTMSGVMLMEDLRDPAHFPAAEATIDTNLVGTIRIIDAFTPHLVGRGSGTFITVTSGIAFLPFPPMPSYAASKAAVHAYSEALRAQLDGTGVDVLELVPPAVATAGQEKVNPHALPLDDFATEVMQLLSTNPTPREILVKGVHMHRWAERDGTYADLVAQRAKALSMFPGREG
ncbi:SDR family oxidoreductase [Micromonospora parva]|uniref:SDR family oxidoreductase n=1 Tax=Micromonospora parva TaxID=1464048 RepID=UPI00366E1146